MPRIARFGSVCFLAASLGLTAPAQPIPKEGPSLTLEQQEKLKERNRLANEASKLQREGKWIESRDTVKKCLAIEIEIFGENHAVTAQSLEWMANLSLQAEDFSAAKESAQRALAIRIKLLGERHWMTVDARLRLADVELRTGLNKEQKADLARAEQLKREYLELYRRGQYRKAIESAEKALALFRTILGVKHPEYAISLNDLALLHGSQGEYVKAEPLHREALTVKKEVFGVKHPEYATSLNNLALLYDSQGQYTRAEPLYFVALAIRKEVLGVKHLDYAASLNNLAMLYVSEGRYAKAEPLCLEARSIYREMYGVKRPEYATSLNNLAGLYKSQGLYAKAEPLYLEARAVYKEALGAKHPDYATSLNNLAGLYNAQGHFAKAEPLYLEALAIRKEVLGVEHPNYASSLNSLATLYDSQDQFAKAEPLYLDALAIRKKVLGEKHSDYAISLNNLAGLYESQGLYAKAEPLYLDALAIEKEVFGAKHPDYATTLSSLAVLYKMQGHFAKAEQLYLEALAIRKEVLGDKHPDYALSLNGLAAVYHSQRQYARAEPLYEEAIGIIEAHLEDTAASQSDLEQLTYIAKTRFYLDNLLFLKDTPASRVYAAALRWHGAVTARQAFARAYLRMPASTGAGRNVRELVNKLRSVSLQMALLVDRPPKGADIPTRYKQLAEERDRYEKELAERSKDFASYREYRKLTPEDLQKKLPRDAVLIDFLAHRDKIAAFIITPTTIARVDLKGGPELAEMVQKFRSELSLQRQRPVQGEDDDSRLYNAIWAPLLPHIGKAQLVLICPDGPLCQVPFAALRGSDPKKYLIEEVAIAVLPVPRMLPELLAGDISAPDAANLLAVGDVDFGTGRMWKALPGTKREIEAVERLFRQAVPGGTYEVLSGKRATPSAIRDVAGKYRYLHFATHGFFLAPLPRPKLASGHGPTSLEERVQLPQINPGLLCGLVCAGANSPTPEEDGNFTALEIMDLDLGGVELAVLSACETGLGEIKAGDGVLGLQRAFQLAGARTIVTSLWKVPDAATSALMIRFYENRLRKKLPVLESLREAQLWVLNHGVEAGVLSEDRPGRRTPPLHWAAFTLAGDWR